LRKKILTLTLLTLVMLTTPLIGSAQACGCGRWRIVDVYTRTLGVDQPTVAVLEEIPGDINKIVRNGSLWIRSGTFRTSAYGSEDDDRGPLGYGTVYMKTMISITHISDENITTSLGEIPKTGKGYGIYGYKLVIEDGPYGEGTLNGVGGTRWEWNLTDPNPLKWRYESWGSVSYMHGTGDFAGVKVHTESYTSIVPALGTYHTKTTVMSLD